MTKKIFSKKKLDEKTWQKRYFLGKKSQKIGKMERSWPTEVFGSLNIRKN